MVHQFNTYQITNLIHSVSQTNIFHTWNQSAGRMIMDQYDSRCIGQNGTLKNLPWMCNRLVKSTYTCNIYIDWSHVSPQIHNSNNFPVIIPKCICHNFYCCRRTIHRFLTEKRRHFHHTDSHLIQSMHFFFLRLLLLHAGIKFLFRTNSANVHPPLLPQQVCSL